MNMFIISRVDNYLRSTLKLRCSTRTGIHRARQQSLESIISHRRRGVYPTSACRRLRKCTGTRSKMRANRRACLKKKAFSKRKRERERERKVECASRGERTKLKNMWCVCAYDI